jgi:hypothetical protein
MNEVFGEENFRNTIFVSRVKKNIQEREAVRALNQGIDYIMCYAKSEILLLCQQRNCKKKRKGGTHLMHQGIRLTMEYEFLDKNHLLADTGCMKKIVQLL